MQIGAGRTSRDLTNRQHDSGPAGLRDRSGPTIRNGLATRRVVRQAGCGTNRQHVAAKVIPGVGTPLLDALPTTVRAPW